MQLLVEVSNVSRQMLTILLTYLLLFKFETDLNKGCEKCEGLAKILSAILKYASEVVPLTVRSSDPETMYWPLGSTAMERTISV